MTLPSVAYSLVGEYYGPGAGKICQVTSPGTGGAIGGVAMADAAEVERAARVALDAFPGWAATPATVRARLLISLARALERDAERVAALITLDNGKTLIDARGEISRAIEHLEAAATAPAVLAGDALMDVVPGVDAQLLREPLGVCAIVSPFNFPIMTGLIYWSWALACGNTVVIKPSEQAPYAAADVGRMIREVGFPPGVVNIVHGGREAVEALCDSPAVAALSLVGSSATAEAVYSRASANGKRVHTAGGARNPIVVLPDADVDQASEQAVASAYTMAGQRCLSSSVLVTVGDVHDRLVDEVVARAAKLTTGRGDACTTDVSPLISRGAVDRLVRGIDAAEASGAVVRLDGRKQIEAQGGYFCGPTLIDDVPADSPLLSEEFFGPLIAVVRVGDLGEALRIVNESPFGNAACLFTTSGAAARRFTRSAAVGNIGINIGVAAPTAQVGFGGKRGSFNGTVHSQGRHAVEFFTDIKSVTTRWQQ
jgi:malonate-semialdehyde dehydrogenase (acetylating) / methylmalonate-semialdehyde dehydrogenase